MFYPFIIYIEEGNRLLLLWLFSLSCRPRQASKSGIERHLMHQQEEIKKDGWLVEKVKKVREISEVLAGPKCKNFDDGAPDSDVVAEIS